MHLSKETTFCQTRHSERRRGSGVQNRNPGSQAIPSRQGLDGALECSSGAEGQSTCFSRFSDESDGGDRPVGEVLHLSMMAWDVKEIDVLQVLSTASVLSCLCRVRRGSIPKLVPSCTRIPRVSDDNAGDFCYTVGSGARNLVQLG